jgi:glycosyltransferase involved in cell wall biosynthesis
MVSLAREAKRLRAEVRIKLRAMTRGDLPPAGARFLAKPIAALLLPASLRARLRRRFVGGPPGPLAAADRPAPGPTRVLQLLVSTAVGGGPTHVFGVATRLPTDEFAVLVAGPDDGPFFRRFMAAGIETHALTLNRLNPLTLVRLVRLVRSRGVKLIHSHGKGAGLYGRLAGGLTGVPVVHTFHGIHFDYWPPLRRLYLGLERALSRRTRMVINVSREQEAEGLRLALFTPAQSTVVVNGIDADGVVAAAAVAAVGRSALGLGPGDLVMGTVARFDPVKRLPLLIGAVEALAVRFPEVKLVLVGGGDEEGRLRRIVMQRGLESRVVFAGVVESAARCFSGWDLYVSASSREGLPLALLEAMACGLPVVATDVPGHREVVVDGVTGLLASAEDAGDLTEKIRMLLEDPTLRRRLGEAARDRAREAFSLDATVRGITGVYRRIVGSAHAT